MKCSIKQQQTTIGYNSIPHAIVEAGTAVVPFGTTLLPLSTTTTTMTLGRRLSKWMLAIVAIMMLLLVVLAGGGTIWLRPDGEMSVAKGLVVATAGIAELCYPDTYNAWGAFGGGSVRRRPVGVRIQRSKRVTSSIKVDSYCWTKAAFVQRFS